MIPLEQRIPGQKHKNIYELVRKQDTVSKIELLEQTKWSVSTMTRTLEELVEQGLIVEAGFGESSGGRRPILYKINPVYGYVFGMEISRSYSMLTLFDMNMTRIDSRRWPMNEGMTPEILIQEVVYTAHNMLAVYGISNTSVLGMGIGAVGPVNRFTGTIIDPPYFPAKGWTDVPIRELFERQLSFPIVLDNGANMAIAGESWASRSHDYQHLLYVHLGVGLRSAMMTSGKVVYGAVDMEGSLGQMIIQTDGPRLRETGNFGSLETYASIHSLEQQARARLKQGRQSMLQEMLDPDKGFDKVNFSDLVRAYLGQDPLVIELFTQAAAYFGIGLANLLNILHPQKVILGGPLINFHPMFFEISTQTAIRNTHHYPAYQVVFSQGNLGADALVTGAAVMVINRITE